MLPVSKKLRIGVWGYGYQTKKNILPAILASNDCHLVGICTTSDDKEREIKEKHDTDVWRNPKAMLADPRVNTIYLATPIGLHYVQAKQVLAADKHLLCEKSLTNKDSSSLDLIEEAEKKGLLLLETFMYLYHPQFQLLRDTIRNSDFGAITNITCNFCIPDLDAPGFRDSKELGGGAFWDVGCYPVSLALALMKEPPKIIFCEMNSPENDEVDMSGKALIQYPSMATAYLNWSYHHSYKNDLSVLGKNKSMYADKVFSKSRDLASAITVIDKFGSKTDLAVPPTDSFTKMLESFAQAMVDPCLREALYDQCRRQANLMFGLFETALRAKHESLS